MNTIKSIIGAVLLLTAFSATANTIELPYVISASNLTQQSFVRVMWMSRENDPHCTKGDSIAIRAYDDGGRHYGPIDFRPVDHNGNPKCVNVLNFNSDDLEFGNPDKYISHGLGSGSGDWRVVLESEQEITAYAYVRTSDGFLTSMHDVMPFMEKGYQEGYYAVTFNPARNRDQVSLLRIVNPNDKTATVAIRGYPDACCAPSDPIAFYDIPPKGAIRVAAQELEEGSELTEMGGKRQILVTELNRESLIVMSLMETSTGHITNLSTMPANSSVAKRRSSSSYEIDLVFAENVPDIVRDAAQRGRRLWEDAIVRSISDARIEIEPGRCDNEHVFNSDVDDLVVFVNIEEMVDSALIASSRVCAYYTQGGRRFTKVGVITINQTIVDKHTSDSYRESCLRSSTCRALSWGQSQNSIVAIQGAGTYGIRVFEHEFAHVIGFNKNHFNAAGYYDTSQSVPAFTGPKAVQAYEESDYRGVGGFEGIPLMHDGSHLDEVFINWRTPGNKNRGAGQGSALMAIPISSYSGLTSITLAALEDLGYTVDRDQAINRSTEPQEPVRMQFTTF